MNNLKSATTLALLGVAAIGFLLLTQQGASSPTPPAHGKSFNAHYTEADLTIGAVVTAENGDIEPGSHSLQLPVLNRAVRISLTFTGADGEMSFGETVACYKTSTAECGFQSGSYVADGAVFALLRLAANPTYPGIGVVGGPDGTVFLQNYHTAAGTVHVAMWY